MNTEKLSKYILIIAGAAAVLFLLPFFLRIFAPFIAAFFIASICQRMVRFLDRRLGISRGISSAAIVTFTVMVILSLAFGAILQLFSQAKNLIHNLPSAIDSFRFQFSALTEKFNGFRLSLPPEISAFTDTAIAKLGDYAAALSEQVASSALNAAKSLAKILPDILIFTVMLILGTFFFIKDYRLITNFLQELLPRRVISFCISAKSIILGAFSSYIKAQLLLMLLTSVLVTLCLWVTGKSYALLWGLVCGLVDALPIFGTAAVLVPWALISLIYGDMYSFVSLMIIQVLVFVVRQLAEPKIISRQIGIHPILTLVSVYIGLKFFGFAGVIFAPILTLLCVNLYVSYKERRSP